MTRVLVAGATGYLGRFVVRAFSDHGYDVRALSRPGSVDKLSTEGPHGEPAVREDVADLFVGTATEPSTLAGLCEGVDVVVSSLGVTRQDASHWAVDYEANRTILDRAIDAGVDEFVFVSVYQPALWGSLIEPRETFVTELQRSPVSHTVVRPTGYFSDMTALFRMARRGRVVLVGDGTARMNPIHGADLAETCVSAVDDSRREIAVGGPDVFAYNDVAELAFRVGGEPATITHLPPWLVTGLVGLVRPVNDRYAALGSAFAKILTTDVVAPTTGTHSLESYYSWLLDRS